jgi:hypothetical protein
MPYLRQRGSAATLLGCEVTRMIYLYMAGIACASLRLSFIIATWDERE